MPFLPKPKQNDPVASYRKEVRPLVSSGIVASIERNLAGDTNNRDLFTRAQVDFSDSIKFDEEGNAIFIEHDQVLVLDKKKQAALVMGATEGNAPNMAFDPKTMMYKDMKTGESYFYNATFPADEDMQAEFIANNFDELYGNNPSVDIKEQFGLEKKGDKYYLAEELDEILGRS